MSDIGKTTALISPATGSPDDGGLRAVAGSLEAIAQEAGKFMSNVREGLTARGKKDAIDAQQNAAASATPGQPVDVDPNNDGMDIFGIRQRSYENTLKYLTIARAEEDAKTAFSGIATTYKADPGGFETAAEEVVKGYIAEAPIEARAAIEQEFRRRMAREVIARTAERRSHDIKEANSRSTAQATDLRRQQTAMVRKDGLAVVNSPEYLQLALRVQDIQDIRQNSLDIVYTDVQRQNDDAAHQRQLEAVALSTSARQVFEDYQSEYEEKLLAGEDPSTLVSAQVKTFDFIEKQLSNMDLTPEEAASARRIIRADVNAAGVEDEAKVAAAIAAEAKVKEAVFADAQVAVSRGNMTYSEIDGLRPEIGDARWSQLTRGRDNYIEALKRKKAAQVDLSSILSGDKLYDRYNTKLRKAMDANYAENVAPQMADEDNPTQAVVNYIARTGHFPETVKSSIRALAINGDGDQKLAAVEMAANVRRASPSAYNELPKDVRDIVDYADRGMDAGMDAPGAIERAYAAIMVDPSIRSTRKKQLTPTFVRENGAQIVQRVFDDKGIEVTDSLRADIDFLFRDEFLTAGTDMGIESVHKAVADQVEKTWGRSRLGMTGERPMRLPPEKMYAVPGLDDKANAKWMREELETFVTSIAPDVEAAAVKAEGGFEIGLGVAGETLTRKPGPDARPEPSDAARKAFLVSDEQTYRGGEKPSYGVYTRDEDGFVFPLLSENGDGVRWAPDWSSSNMSRNMENRAKRDQEKALAKARKKRAELQAWDPEAALEAYAAEGGAGSDLYDDPYKGIQ